MEKAKRFNKMLHTLSLVMVGVWTMMAVITGGSGEWVVSALFAASAVLAAMVVHWSSEALETIKKIEKQENEW